MNSISVEAKLALGTAQLGLPYGINNKTGKPDLNTAFQILECAREHGIDTLDSADAYGDSIQVIGSYLKTAQQAKFRIVNKFFNDGMSIEKKLAGTLNALGTEKLYGYMYHRFDDYRAGAFRRELVRLKADNKVEKIGASVYSVQELEAVIRDTEITLIQLPLNPFDTSAEKLELLEEAKSLGKEIHVRSVFLQGIFFKKPNELTGNLTGLRKPVEEFHEIVKTSNLNTMQACLNYALHLRVVDSVVIGVETRQQLEANIAAVLPEINEAVLKDLGSIRVADRSLLNPSNWKP